VQCVWKAPQEAGPVLQSPELPVSHQICNSVLVHLGSSDHLWTLLGRSSFSC
ncbi:hypothetical protein ATANTOWER_027114, partial [Ataeniobius toweri]|nr:hypothetical protein [Ataeniobius toweri]